MALKKFYVGVKAFIRSDKGILMLKHSSGYWDFPGGRIDDSESFIQALKREIAEELPGSELLESSEIVGASRIGRDIDENTGLVVLFYDTIVSLPESLNLSEEHTTYTWVSRSEDLPEPMNEEARRILMERFENNNYIDKKAKA